MFKQVLEIFLVLEYIGYYGNPQLLVPQKYEARVRPKNSSLQRPNKGCFPKQISLLFPQFCPKNSPFQYKFRDVNVLKDI